MELKATKREKNCKVIRREGNIPAIFYSQGKEGEELIVGGGDFRKILNQIQPGTLSTTIFTLDVGGKKRKAILKDIQYHVTTYEISHLDFEELVDGVPVTLNVPIQCTGVVDCIGIKLGGSLHQIVRTIKVRCLPKDIPSQFEVDIRELNVGQGKRVGDISIPKAVQPMIDTKNMAVVIAKR